MTGNTTAVKTLYFVDEQRMTRPAPDPDLQRTVAQAAAGDAEAWRRLVEAYSPRVFGLLVRQCGDRELAEEITQAAFVQVVAHIGRYSEKGRFAPWLFRIAMNCLRDEMRRRKRQARPIDMTGAGSGGTSKGVAGGGSGGTSGGGGGQEASEWAVVQDSIVTLGAPPPADPLEQVSQAEQIQRLRHAVAQLPEKDRQILHLRHTADLTFAQIAETLQQPLGTVLARGHRALAKLRKIMEERG